MKYVCIAYGLMWLSTAIAVCVGIYCLHSIHCLWFMIIPSFVHIHVDADGESEVVKKK